MPTPSVNACVWTVSMLSSGSRNEGNLWVQGLRGQREWLFHLASMVNMNCSHPFSLGSLAGSGTHGCTPAGKGGSQEEGKQDSVATATLEDSPYLCSRDMRCNIKITRSISQVLPTPWHAQLQSLLRSSPLAAGSCNLPGLWKRVTVLLGSCRSGFLGGVLARGPVLGCIPWSLCSNQPPQP